MVNEATTEKKNNNIATVETNRSEPAPPAPGISSKEFSKKPQNQKQTTLIITVGVIVLAAIFLISSILLKPKYQLLYSQLEQSDAAAISSYLQKNKVRFEISPDGSSIGVTDSSVPKLRLELASKGLPRGSGVGFEIFDKSNLTVTDFGQKLNYRRALEGELARTISSLESIESARVHLAIAKKSLFQDDEEKSSASVIIKPSGELSQAQINGISHLVASAIQGLAIENIHIADAQGNSLVEASDEEALKNKKILQNENFLKEYQHNLEKGILKLINPIVGKGNVLVNVTAVINFDESEMNIELFSPTGEDGNKVDPVIRSEKVISERFNKKQGPGSSGTPGSQSNLPSFTGKANNTGSSDDKGYLKEDSTRNYEVSKKVERVKKASGLIERLSVAVVINKDLSPAERATLRETTIVASGLDLERGDQVIITGIRFSSTPNKDKETERNEKEVQNQEIAQQFKKFASLGIAIILALILVSSLITLMKSPLEASKAKELDELLDQESMPLLDSINAKLKETQQALEQRKEETEQPGINQMKRDLSKLALEDPQAMARGLRAFIDE